LKFTCLQTHVQSYFDRPSEEIIRRSNTALNTSKRTAGRAKCLRR